MKSKRESTTRGHKGFSKGQQDNLYICHRLGPIIIEDILARATRISKSDPNIREMEMRTELLNEQSPRIKQKFKPLDNPATVLEVLCRILVIKEGVNGNNVTTGHSLLHAKFSASRRDTSGITCVSPQVNR